MSIEISPPRDPGKHGSQNNEEDATLETYSQDDFYELNVNMLGQ